jgi:O-methyltransferase involved in polyketide biosynthesis
VPDYSNDLAREGHLESIEKPSSARVYDHLLGGHHNYAIDREFAAEVLRTMPFAADTARSNRLMTGRAVRYALDRGVSQFVDIGSGLPSQGQAHEIADTYQPEAKARVIYIDNEPIAHAHAEILLERNADTDRHRALIADFAEPESLWRQVKATELIDPAKPTCLIVTALVHFQPPERRPDKTMAYYRDQVAPGSVLILTHLTESGDGIRSAAARYEDATDQMYRRTPDEIRAFFGEWELVSPEAAAPEVSHEPELCWTAHWRPDGTELPWWGDDPSRCAVLAGVAVKSGKGAP